MWRIVILAIALGASLTTYWFSQTGLIVLGPAGITVQRGDIGSSFAEATLVISSVLAFLMLVARGIYRVVSGRGDSKQKSAAPQPVTSGTRHALAADPLQSLLSRLSLLKPRFQKPTLEAMTYDGKIPDFLWACFYWGSSPSMLKDEGAAVGIFRPDKFFRIILGANTKKPWRVMEVKFSDMIELQRSRETDQHGGGYSGKVTTIIMTHEVWDSLSFDDTYQTLYAALRSALGPNLRVTVG
jgi:hypothetical protein